jgi:hypothetical protein
MPAPSSEAPGFFGGAEQGAGLVFGFGKFRVRITVEHHAAPSLDIHKAVFDNRGAQRNAGVDIAAR